MAKQNPEEIALSNDAANENAEARDEDQVGKVVVTRGRIPSPFQEALLDFGKELVKGSVAQSVEFHKTMLGLTATFTTLMASTFAVLAFGWKDHRLDTLERLFLIVPVVLMLCSSVCFAIGFFPRHVKMTLRYLDTIEEARHKLLTTRRRWASAGTSLFVLSILSLLAGVIILNLC